MRLLFWSSFLIVGAALVYEFIRRWLLMTRRSMSLKEAVRKRTESEAARQAGEGAAEASSEVPPAPEPEMDLAVVNQQTLRLVRGAVGVSFIVSLYLLWGDVLPALGFLRQAHLWTVETAGGIREITVLSIVWAIGLLFVTMVVVRDVRGFLEMTALRKLSPDRGTRFTIITLTRYVIIIVGVVGAFGALGIGWSKVQWLIAAVSVGLGFGLQEIFANFVSGVVILFERPIRIGDIVTVGDIIGRVTQIRMRATTIMDFDRKELIVPNTQFITGHLINWTLTDPVIRINIAIGVIYGSDTRKVEQLLLQVARENPVVLEDPEPSVIFTKFGDNSLDFNLYAYLPHRDFYLEVIHALHSAIDQEFREAGIKIAFPQRDVHFDSPRPMEVRIVTGKDKGKEAVAPERESKAALRPEADE